MAIYDVEAEELVKRVAAELEKEDAMRAPEWAPFVKTGTHKDRRPTQTNWWYLRSASVLRKIFAKGPIGVSKLRTEYGGRKNRGVQPEIFCTASGNILRKILQRLEKAGLAKQVDKNGRKGRMVTPKGHTLLETISSQMLKEKGIQFKEKPEVELPVKKAAKKKTAKRKTTKKKAAKESPEQKAPAAAKQAEAQGATEEGAKGAGETETKKPS